MEEKPVIDNETPAKAPAPSEKIAPYIAACKAAFKKAYDSAHAWLLQDAHKQRAAEIKGQVGRAFTEHPQDTGETYTEHLWFTITMTGRLFYSSVVLLVHGIFPFLCTRTASMQIEKIYAIMRSRIPQHRRDELNKGLDI